MTPDEIKAIAVDTLYAARDRGQNMHDAAYAVVEAITPFIAANALRNVTRDGYVDVARCQEFANSFELRGLQARKDAGA